MDSVPNISERKADPTSNQSASSNEASFRGAQKYGPSYNKRVITTPDDDLLSSFDENNGTMETKTWINPKFDAVGHVLEMGDFTPKRDRSLESSKYSEPFVLQGPRESDEEDILAEEAGFPSNAIYERECKDRRRRRFD